MSSYKKIASEFAIEKSLRKDQEVDFVSDMVDFPERHGWLGLAVKNCVPDVVRGLRFRHISRLVRQSYIGGETADNPESWVLHQENWLMAVMAANDEKDFGLVLADNPKDLALLCGRLVAAAAGGTLATVGSLVNREYETVMFSGCRSPGAMLCNSLADEQPVQNLRASVFSDRNAAKVSLVMELESHLIFGGGTAVSSLDFNIPPAFFLASTLNRSLRDFLKEVALVDEVLRDIDPATLT